MLVTHVSYPNSIMEAEDGSQSTTVRLVPWREDWDQFKRLFKASARLNGVLDAVKAGEALAESRNGLAKAKVSSEAEGSSHSEKETIYQRKDDRKISTKALKQAPKLAAMLTLTLIDTVGAQQSIITDELEGDEDGVAAWAALVMHFEYSTEDLRAEARAYVWTECGSYPYTSKSKKLSQGCVAVRSRKSNLCTNRHWQPVHLSSVGR